MNGDLRVSIFTNTVGLHVLSLYKYLRDSLGGLRIFVSTPMERGRDWTAEWGDLPVRVQKTLSYRTYKRYEGGFRDEIWRHIPYDTLPLLIRGRPDVVISTEFGFRTMQAAVYRMLFPKSRLIVWVGLSEHTEKGVPAWRVLQRKALLGLADAVSANGTSAINYLQWLGVPSEKIFRLPYCPDISGHLKLPLEREPSAARRLLYVGGLSERKGLAPFLTVLSDWLRKRPDDRWELWIAGDGPLRVELERFSTPPQLRLQFLGSVAYERLPELYAQGGVFVFPTLADEWGVVVNEALAAGLPVLGSVYSQAVKELVQEGETGWTFRPDQPEEVERALDRALLTPAPTLAGMRETCRRTASQLTPSYGANQLLQAVRFAIASQVPAPLEL